jgi:hypothetical protein
MCIHQSSDGTHRRFEDRSAQLSNPRSQSAIDQQGGAIIDDRGNVAAVPRKDIKTFTQVGNLQGATLKLFRSLLDDVSSVPACAAAREAAPVIITAKASACVKANEDRFLGRTFILLFFSKCRALGSEVCRAEIQARKVLRRNYRGPF